MKIPFLQFGDDTPLGRQLRFIAEQLKKLSESMVDGYNLSPNLLKSSGGLAFTAQTSTSGKQIYSLIVDSTQNSYVHPKRDANNIQRGLELIVDSTDTATGKVCIVDKSDTTKQIISAFPVSSDGKIQTNYGSFTLESFAAAFLSSGTDSDVLITSGTGSATHAGGAISLTAGQGGLTSGDGGSIFITGGAAKTLGLGGTVTLTAGAGKNTSSGGNIVIIAGKNGTSSTTATGFTSIKAADGNGTSGAGLTGGTVAITGGAGKSTGAGGVINITGGAGGNGATGNGGALTLTGGAALSTAGTGGAISLTGGVGTTTGNGGALSLTGGVGGSTGTGGAITVTGGAAAGTNQNGGAVTIAGGLATGNGTGGTITITPGNTSTGATGNLELQDGTATTRLKFDASDGLVKPIGSWKFTQCKVDDTTGAGSAALGANSPASTLTAPYTWFKFLSSDGSAVYVPAWK